MNANLLCETSSTLSGIFGGTGITVLLKYRFFTKLLTIAYCSDRKHIVAIHRNFARRASRLTIASSDTHHHSKQLHRSHQHSLSWQPFQSFACEQFVRLQTCFASCVTACAAGFQMLIRDLA